MVCCQLLFCKQRHCRIKIYKTPLIGVSRLKPLEVSCNLPSTKVSGKLQLTSRGFETTHTSMDFCTFFKLFTLCLLICLLKCHLISGSCKETFMFALGFLPQNFGKVGSDLGTILCHSINGG